MASPNITVTVEQYLANRPYLVGQNVTIADTGANIAALSAEEFGLLAANNVDAINVTGDNLLSLSTAQYLAMAPYLQSGTGVLQLTSGDTVTLADTGENLALLTAAEMTALAGNRIDAINATDDVLTLTREQYNAINSGTVVLTQADTVTMIDTVANLLAYSNGQINAMIGKGIDFFGVSDGPLVLTVAQYNALAPIVFDANASVVLTDSAANLEALTASQLAGLEARGVDSIDSTDDTFTLNVEKYRSLGTVTFTSADVVTLVDTDANIGGMTAAEIAALDDTGVDNIDSTDDTISLTAQQAAALGAVVIASGDVVTLADTGENIAALTSTEIGALDDAGIDFINATDDSLDLTADQAIALGTVVIDAGDSVTLVDTGANASALTASQIAALETSGFDSIDTSDDILSLTVAKLNALGAVTLTAGDVVTLRDSGANLAALTALEIAGLDGLGVDIMNANDDVLVLSQAQYEALGDVALAAADDITVEVDGDYTLGSDVDNLNLLGTGDWDGTGNAGNNILYGNSGDNDLDGAGGSDDLRGGAGDDTYHIDGGDIVREQVSAGNDTVISSASYTLAANIENLILTGSDDIAAAGNGRDNSLTGNDGDNRIAGRRGQDTLTGGDGADRFVFADGHTGATHATADSILDFSASEGDKIVLRSIDANSDLANNQRFTFIGTDAFSNTAGELRYEEVAGSFFVEGDTDGDGVADVVIEVQLDTGTTLTATDFLL